MKKKILIIIVLAALILAGVFTFMFLMNNENQKHELKEKMEVASKDYFEKYISANDSVNIYKVTLKDLEDANKNGEEYDLKGLEKCDKEKTFANITINYQNGTAKKAQVELKC